MKEYRLSESPSLGGPPYRYLAEPLGCSTCFLGANPTIKCLNCYKNIMKYRLFDIIMANHVKVKLLV